MGSTISTCLTGCSGILMSIYIVGTDTAFSLMSLTLHGGLPPAEGAALLEGMSWSAAKRRAQSAFLDQRCNPGSILRSASSRVKLVVCCLLNADGSLQLLQNCIYHELPWSAVRPVGPILHQWVLSFSWERCSRTDCVYMTCFSCLYSEAIC